MQTNEEIAAKFLMYSFRDIQFRHMFLTPAEQAHCTEEEYNRTVAWAYEMLIKNQPGWFADVGWTQNDHVAARMTCVEAGRAVPRL